MRVFEILHLDHGGGNLSTFSGKAVASGGADMYESLIGAMAALAGPKHGKANQECLEFVKQCLQQVDELTEDGVARLVRQRLNNKQLIFGFGHAVLRVEDPRATVFCDLGEELCADDDAFKMVQLLRKVVPGILMENPKISNPYPNVDLASGSLLNACGLTDPEYYTVSLACRAASALPFKSSTSDKKPVTAKARQSFVRNMSTHQLVRQNQPITVLAKSTNHCVVLTAADIRNEGEYFFGQPTRGRLFFFAAPTSTATSKCYE